MTPPDPREEPRGLREEDLRPDPFEQFRHWREEARAADLPEPHPDAMTLATATADGRPAARLVLLRGLDARGFVFFTNSDSRKGAELAHNPRAALVFYWAELHRQVRIEGAVEAVTDAEADAYFHSRPVGHQLSAWVSPQSRVIPDRAFLERRMREVAAEHAGGPVPRPPYWGGYRVVPASVEFWQGQPDRLHDRLRYERTEAGGWRVHRLAP